MKVLKIILIVIAAIIVLLLSIFAYYGGFSKVEFSNEHTGGETVVYKSVTGDFSQVPLILDDVKSKLMNEYGIKVSKGYSRYYDNPEEVAVEDLRFDGGYIVNITDSTIIKEISKDLKITTIPEGKYPVAYFPFKGEMSVFVGLMRVYPEMQVYTKDNNYPENTSVIEIYDSENEVIEYRIVK